MKTRAVRIAAATFALGVLFAGPAAASTPAPVLVSPAPVETVSPNLHACTVMPWWFWCR